MASITISVPDEYLPDLVAALRWKYPTLSDETPADGALAKAIIRECLRGIYAEYKVQVALGTIDQQKLAAYEESSVIS